MVKIIGFYLNDIRTKKTKTFCTQRLTVKELVVFPGQWGREMLEGRTTNVVFQTRLYKNGLVKPSQFTYYLQKLSRNCYSLACISTRFSLNNGKYMIQSLFFFHYAGINHLCGMAAPLSLTASRVLLVLYKMGNFVSLLQQKTIKYQGEFQCCKNIVKPSKVLNIVYFCQNVIYRHNRSEYVVFKIVQNV